MTSKDRCARRKYMCGSDKLKKKGKKKFRKKQRNSLAKFSKTENWQQTEEMHSSQLLEDQTRGNKIAPHNTHENDPDRIKASSRLNEEESGDEKTEERGDNHEAEANIQTEDSCRRQTKNKINYSEGSRSFRRINNATGTKMLMSMILVLGLKLELINLERLSYKRRDTSKKLQFSKALKQQKTFFFDINIQY